MQILVAALIAVLVFLQYLLWIAEDGVRQTYALRVTIQAQTEENAELNERNRALEADIKDLKSGLVAIEERARSEMGMIRRDETFYRILEQPPKSVVPAKPPIATAKPPAQPVKPPATTAKPSLAQPAKPPAQPVKPPAATAKPSPIQPAKSPAATAKPSPTQPVKPPTTTAKPSPAQPIKPPAQPIKLPTTTAKPSSAAPAPLRPAGSPADRAQPR
jgi:cell division protein FtsB